MWCAKWSENIEMSSESVIVILNEYQRTTTLFFNDG